VFRSLAAESRCLDFVLKLRTIVLDLSTKLTPPEMPFTPASVLFGKTRRRVLGWLLGHPDEAFYLRQIVRHTGSAQGAVQRELDTLTKAGLLLRRVQGRQVYFQANRESPVFPELRGLFLKTAGLADVLREALAPLSNEIELALIFGSAARGDLRRGSDIDLLVVGDASFTAVANLLSEAQERLGRDVNPTVYLREEFKRKIRNRHHFLERILGQSHLFLIGGMDELARLGTKRVGHRSPDEPDRDPRPARRRGARSR
jgi:uncharacterized protein